MKLTRFRIATLGLLTASGLGWSCSSKSDNCNANLNCAPYGTEIATSGTGSGSLGGSSGASGISGTGGSAATNADGGTDIAAGTGGGGGALPVCDGSQSPDADACVISDEFGVFVAPTGDDKSADGTQTHPYATLTKALASVAALKHVYVCAADYHEPSTLEIPDRVSIFGGFTCEDGNWNYDSALPAHLLPASPIGATITDAKVGVLIQDVRIDAAVVPINTAGGSSFGLIVNSSQHIVLRQVEIRAGKATAGNDGIPGLVSPDGVTPDSIQNGSAACSTMPLIGSGSAESSCGSKGGNGGLGYSNVNGDPGLTGLPTENLIEPGKANGGVGATQSGPNFPGTNGDRGSPGKAGNEGAIAPSIGTFSATGYQVASGGDGSDGHPGQGGGGGGASKGIVTCVGASGGAGGMGGCGGRGGTGASGGGASVAVLSWNSSLVLDGATLTAGPGGAGGKGGLASPGGTGMAGGSGGGGSTVNGVAKGGNGGDGGPGGNGGNGGGGSGGPSIALFWGGTQPIQMGNSHLNAGEGGKAGQGGRLGTDSEKWGPDGKTGASEPIFPKAP